MIDDYGLPFDEGPDETAAGGPRPPRPYSISELTTELKTLVERRFSPVAVEGEVSNCKQWSSGHIYFTLKDDLAQLRAVVFRMTARLLKFRLHDGMHVVARGRISVYEVKGEYQLVCDAIEPQGLGALQAAFEQLKRRLDAEGLFAAARKRPLPALPRRIGIVTSADGAALRDILKVLIARHPTASVVIRPARVQGEDAPADLIRALRAIARVPDLDVVIIGRGGGSAEDLWAFNDERLARAIAACPVPVIAAVGHEVDVTIADFVADVRAATPSNAAEIVVERADHVRARIETAARRLRQAAAHAVARAQQRAGRRELQLERWPTRVMLRDRDVEEIGARLERAWRVQQARRAQRFETLRRRLEQRDVRRVAAALVTRVVRAEARLRELVTVRRHAAEAAAGRLAARLDALSPLSVLGRGYAVCWNATRTSIIRTAAAVDAGDHVRVTLADGELDCRVEAAVDGAGRPGPATSS